MTHITIAISDDQISQLREMAARFQVTPEELVRVSLEDLLTRSEETFQNATHYVLSKNEALYQRLA